MLPLVYGELRKLAQARMARLPPGQTLQPTALVHEEYLRLLGKTDLQLESKRHFFFAAARAMRDILIEQACSKAGPKCSGGRRRVELKEDVAASGPASTEVLALQEALAELEKQDPLKDQIVNLRYYAGMSMEETAQVLDLSDPGRQADPGPSARPHRAGLSLVPAPSPGRRTGCPQRCPCRGFHQCACSQPPVGRGPDRAAA